MRLIVESSGNGQRRICDAKCHNAPGLYCYCICGGRFHGVGKKPGGLAGAIQSSGLILEQELSLPLGTLALAFVRGKPALLVRGQLYLDFSAK